MTRSAFGREKVLKMAKNESLGRKKFSLRVLLKTQFGEKRGMGRTMERKIAGEKSVSRCGRGGDWWVWETGALRKFLKNILNVFSFLSLSLLLRKIQLPPRGSRRATTWRLTLQKKKFFLKSI